MSSYNIPIHEYTTRTYNVNNAHRYIGIPKHEKHVRLLSSGTKLFITFEFKGFSMLAFPSAHPQHAWHPTQGHCELAKVTLLLRTARLNSTNRLNPPRTLLVHDVIHIPKSYLGFLFWHLWMTHPPRARVKTCAQVCTYLTHALSRKIFSLTKPKGKIYKTKSLGHYIT